MGLVTTRHASGASLSPTNEVGKKRVFLYQIMLSKYPHEFIFDKTLGAKQRIVPPPKIFGDVYLNPMDCYMQETSIEK
jgi:hypothetical protein